MKILIAQKLIQIFQVNSWRSSQVIIDSRIPFFFFIIAYLKKKVYFNKEMQIQDSNARKGKKRYIESESESK